MGLLATTNAHRRVTLYGLGMLLVILTIVPSPLARAERKARERIALVVIVGKDSKADDISLSQLERRYNGNDSSRTLIPFNMPPGSAERLAFDKAVLDLSQSQVGRYWIDRKIRGQSSAPRSLTGTLQLAKVVARFPGALGYMRADKLPRWVKALKVGGKKHTDADYPLFVEVQE